MFCKNCGSKLEDDSVFCPVCGSKVDDENGTDDNWDYSTGWEEDSSDPENGCDSDRKNLNSLIWGMGIGLLLVALVAVIALAVMNLKKDETVQRERQVNTFGEQQEADEEDLLTAEDDQEQVNAQEQTGNQEQAEGQGKTEAGINDDTSRKTGEKDETEQAFRKKTELSEKSDLSGQTASPGKYDIHYYDEVLERYRKAQAIGNLTDEQRGELDVNWDWMRQDEEGPELSYTYIDFCGTGVPVLIIAEVIDDNPERYFVYDMYCYTDGEAKRLVEDDTILTRSFYIILEGGMICNSVHMAVGFDAEDYYQVKKNTELVLLEGMQRAYHDEYFKYSADGCETPSTEEEFEKFGDKYTVKKDIEWIKLDSHQENTAGNYILPDSNIRLLTDADLKGLSAKELRYARNEIFARYGRKFKDKELQKYFDNQNWYHGTIEADDFNMDKMLNSIEKKNIKLIEKYENNLSGNGGSGTTAVTRTVDLYPGVYADQLLYGDPDQCTHPYGITVSNVTDTSFDFEIWEYYCADKPKQLVFKKHTAVFNGDGSTAIYEGKQYTLHFTFPSVFEVGITGFEPTEGGEYLCNTIPGHPAS